MHSLEIEFLIWKMKYEEKKKEGEGKLKDEEEKKISRRYSLNEYFIRL